VARLKDNGIPVMGFNGANASHAKTRDRQLAFFNKRAARAAAAELRRAGREARPERANVGYAHLKDHGRR
jgi:hypothetical protein